MIRINLLPFYREELRKRRKDQFNQMLGLALLCGMLLVGVVHLAYQWRIDAQDERNTLLEGQIAVLDSKIREIDQLEQEIQALHARQRAVEDLQAGRNLPVHMINELMRQLPEGLTIASLEQTGDTVEIRGLAQSNERVSQLLHNLSSSSTWFTGDQLQETVSETIQADPVQYKVVRYVLRFSLQRAPTSRMETLPGQERH